ncbi:uncharacterized protein LOC122303926 [Carya illinoinensis]|uniref:Ankyrin repeat protein n=1 Tax=Carya illinoinensis TaxID=32201 RepID=A0A8T1RKK3_CARIL|nr:uncharacterized protein LOC122303926 [Carya illinoinensis]KAG6667195.1 hypothetical protein CIPAW_01G084100 [Carya illinoinensis]
MEVDPKFSFGAGENPLYLAVERRFPNLVSEILIKFKSPAYDGPFGRTALHSEFWDDEGINKNILGRYGCDQCKQADQNGVREYSDSLPSSNGGLNGDDGGLISGSSEGQLQIWKNKPR